MSRPSAPLINTQAGLLSKPSLRINFLSVVNDNKLLFHSGRISQTEATVWDVFTCTRWSESWTFSILSLHVTLNIRLWPTCFFAARSDIFWFSRSYFLTHQTLLTFTERESRETLSAAFTNQDFYTQNICRINNMFSYKLPNSWINQLTDRNLIGNYCYGSSLKIHKTIHHNITRFH